MAHYIDYNQTDGSTPVATLNRVGSVKPDGTSINISADGTINADSSYISTQAMPSNRYIDLTLLASGSQYTAPANGLVNFIKASNDTNQYALLNNLTAAIISMSQHYASGDWQTALLPVKKGDIFQADYNAGGQIIAFKFIYAQGETN